ncbi:KAP family NTPase [Kosakonia sacchari]|uniref:KAP family P-loop NTPase fold protein n=1 Tax=Kosakonia sacchari TaxID=1158459 RepID=UPI002ACED741|nr:P-loop NTPase fold protein [Kosakonia sacchari]MDZ7320118.1 KAP family NTPase [Kosakonia sacchari]
MMTIRDAVSPEANHRLGSAITRPDQDRYGFVHVAHHLRLAIERLGRKGSAVIGIEGPWGSGKSSLLTLLETELRSKPEPRTFILKISPWLNGDSVSPVSSLLLPVAGIVDTEEMKQAPWWRWLWLWLRKRKKSAFIILQYLQTTSRHLASISDVAALIPGVPNTGSLFRALSKISLKEKKKTAAELRSDIATRLEKLDLSFIVLIDDLDRLEPEQAVEVVRLVKSVADFPRFRYILCYDRDVLASAVTTGMQVSDGATYLQKILQLTFSLPKPESFDLRREFTSGACALFCEVNGEEPDASIIAAIENAADNYGKQLNTPREVRLALDALSFRYPGVCDYVYFPDLCLLQLLRVTNAPLYDWIELYLTERSVVVSGDGMVSESDTFGLAEKLWNCLQMYGNDKAGTAFTLNEWIPGIRPQQDDDPGIFIEESEERETSATVSRRLASITYWRYYFAFSAPQNILLPEYFTELFALAARPDSAEKLASELLSRINSNGITSRTWFEHIVSQLTGRVIAGRSFEECAGLLRFFFNYNDGVRLLFTDRNAWFSWQTLGIEQVVHDLLRRMLSLKRKRTICLLSALFTRGSAWFWAAQFMRNLLVKNGLAQYYPAPEAERLLTDDELIMLRQSFAVRMRDRAVTDNLFIFDNLLRYMHAWEDIDLSNSVAHWVQAVCQNDDGFLNLLLRFRSTVHSSHQGTYLELRLEYFAELAAMSKEDIRSRLDRLAQQPEWSETVRELRNDSDE